MRNEIIKWNPAFFGGHWSIYSYFGIVWKQNIMNKFNLLKVKLLGIFVIKSEKTGGARPPCATPFRQTFADNQ